MDAQSRMLVAVLVLGLVAIGGAVLFRQESGFDRYARMVCAESKQACDDLYVTTPRPE
jgi:hypothetical protein